MSMRDIIGYIWRRGILWPQTGTTHYYAQLELADKGCAFKVLCSGDKIYEGNFLMTCAKCTSLVPCCDQHGYRAQVPHHPIKS